MVTDEPIQLALHVIRAGLKFSSLGGLDGVAESCGLSGF